MRRPLRYSDAVRMLGGGESRLLAFLDTVGSGALAGLDMLDLFEVKREAVRLADQALKGLRRRLSGLDALTRSERLAAAHWIIAITAFFEAVEEHLRAAGIDELGASAGEQVVVITETLASDESLLGISRALAGRGAIPDIGGLYQERAERFAKHLRGLALYDGLTAAQRDAVNGWRLTLPETAVARYEERLRELAGECPEFGIWLTVSAHARTLDAVHEVHSGLVRLETYLTGTLARPAETSQDVRHALSLAYRAVLDKAITQQAASDLDVPTLGEGYIDHRFRVANWHPTTNPAQDAWWEGSTVRDDLDLYLASYLVSAVAQVAPLLVLGHPGSGKSVLTRVLAARLPADRFLPIRVELRSVDADADLQSQIEEAVRLSTGETVRWPELARSAPETMPVVLLDGFDELLQATGVAQTDFLERVSRFQERELDQGRAVAVLVTSRIAVADRARIPSDTVVMCLEPFDRRQVGAWLDVWAARNGAILARRGLRPLTAESVLEHSELAAQPLMLLMLALYDASANALRNAAEPFSEAALYEALLKDFARREVEKEQNGPADDDAVEQELARLSVVAFAMFNRRAQWVTDEDLTADLAGLRMAPLGTGERRMQKNLTPGQLAVGRFFFIHDTRALRDGSVSQTYEFLHATFGEFLIARFVAKLIGELAAARRRASSLLPSTVDDGWLHALLSFECLAARAPVIEFLTSLLSRDPLVTELLLELFAGAFEERSDTLYSAYRPMPVNVVQRHANWSANLMLLAVVAGGEVKASQLFHGPEDPAAEWRNAALLWRGQLSSEGRNGLIRLLTVERTKSGSVRDITLSVSWKNVVFHTPLDLAYEPDESRTLVQGYGLHWMMKKLNFTSAKAEDVLFHSLVPLLRALPNVAFSLIQLETEELVTPIHLLLSALTAFTDAAEAEEAVQNLTALLQALDTFEMNDRDVDALRSMANGVTLALSFGDPALAATTPALPSSAASPAPSPSPEASSPGSPATPPDVP